MKRNTKIIIGISAAAAAGVGYMIYDLYFKEQEPEINEFTNETTTLIGGSMQTTNFKDRLTKPEFWQIVTDSMPTIKKYQQKNWQKA